MAHDISISRPSLALAALKTPPTILAWKYRCFLLLSLEAKTARSPTIWSGSKSAFQSICSALHPAFPAAQQPARRSSGIRRVGYVGA
jgi:hypothetical protein